MTDLVPELTEIIARLRRARRRWLVRLLITQTCAAGAVLLMALVVLGATRFALPQFWTQDLRPSLIISVLLRPGAALIVPLLIIAVLLGAYVSTLMFVKWTSITRLSIAADKTFGLQERIATVLDPALSGGSSAIHTALVQDAQRHAQGIDPTILVPMPTPRVAWSLPVLAFAAAVLWLLPRPSGPFADPIDTAGVPAGSATAPMSSEVRQALSGQLLETSDLTAVEAEGQNDPLLAAVANTLERLAQDVAADADLSLVQIVVELSSISEYLGRAGLSAESLIPDDLNDFLADAGAGVLKDLAAAGASGNGSAGQAGLPRGRGAAETRLASADPRGSEGEDQESQTPPEFWMGDQKGGDAEPDGEGQATTEPSEPTAEAQRQAIADGGSAEQQVEPGGRQEDGGSTPNGEGRPTTAQSDYFNEVPRQPEGTTLTADAGGASPRGIAGEFRNPTASPWGEENNSFSGQDRMAAAGESPAALDSARRTEVVIEHSQSNDGGQVQRTDRPEIMLSEIEDTLPSAYGSGWHASDEEPVSRPYLAPSHLEPVSEYFIRLRDRAPQ